MGGLRQFCMLLSATFLLFAGQGYAQTSEEISDRNLADFEFVIETISNNYAGWDTKVTDETRPALDALTTDIRSRAATASDGEFADLVREWLAFFNDGHVSLGSEGPQPEPAEGFPSMDWSEETVRERVNAQDNPHPLEGIWAIAEDYRLGILRTGSNPDRFAVVVLTTTSESWRPGQIKAEIVATGPNSYEVAYQDGWHVQRDLTARLTAGNTILSLSQYSAWEKQWPQSAEVDDIARLVPPGDIFMRRLSDDTLWLRMPDFGDARFEPLSALLSEHADALRTAPNLIIDVRRNGGGSDYVYAPLIDLLYTHPIISIGAEVWATELNVETRRALLERLREDYPDAIPGLEQQIALMEANLGSYVRDESVGFDIITRDRTLPNPQRVAILIDGAASSGEEFLLAARQSRKVTLFGHDNSAGVLDFANVTSAPLPSGRHSLSWATSRSLRLPGYPVDPDGIPPDIRIPPEVEDPIGYVMEWLESGTE